MYLAENANVKPKKGFLRPNMQMTDTIMKLNKPDNVVYILYLCNCLILMIPYD